MTSYKISVDLESVQNVSGTILAAVFPRVRMALDKIATLGAEEWQGSVGTAHLWTGEKTPYKESITWRFTSDLSAIIESDYPLAEEIETGRPRKDLKRMLDTSPKARLTKDGRRYLVIPFRHNVDTLEAAGVYKDAKALTESRVKSKHLIPSRIGLHDIKTKSPWLVPSRRYQWGEHLQSDDQKLNHMYRFNTSAGKGKSSAYLTFRVMMEGSPGWIIQPRPGLFLAKGVADGLIGRLNFAIGEAVASDLTSV